MITPSSAERGAWLLLIGVLGLAIGIETDWGRQVNLPTMLAAKTAPQFEDPVLVPPFQLLAPDQYLEMSLRPLFIAARRPAPTMAAVEPPKPMMKRDQFTLTGIAIVPEGKFAFLMEKSINKVHVVTEGKEVSGIKVAEVHPNHVVLTQYDESEVVVLKTAKGPSQSLVAQPPPGPDPMVAPPQTRPALPPPVLQQAPAGLPPSAVAVPAPSSSPPTPSMGTGKPPQAGSKGLGLPGAGNSGTRFGP